MTKSEFRSSWSDCGTAIVTFREILYNNPSGFENSTGELNTRTVLNTGTYFTSKFLLYNSIKTTVSMTTSTAVRGGNVEFRGSLKSCLQSQILSDFKISKALHCTCGQCKLLDVATFCFRWIIQFWYLCFLSQLYRVKESKHIKSVLFIESYEFQRPRGRHFSRYLIKFTPASPTQT